MYCCGSPVLPPVSAVNLVGVTTTGQVFLPFLSVVQLSKSIQRITCSNGSRVQPRPMPLLPLLVSAKAGAAPARPLTRIVAKASFNIGNLLCFGNEEVGPGRM